MEPSARKKARREVRDNQDINQDETLHSFPLENSVTGDGAQSEADCNDIEEPSGNETLVNWDTCCAVSPVHSVDITSNSEESSCEDAHTGLDPEDVSDASESDTSVPPIELIVEATHKPDSENISNSTTPPIEESSQEFSDTSDSNADQVSDLNRSTDSVPQIEESSQLSPILYPIEYSCQSPRDQSYDSPDVSHHSVILELSTSEDSTSGSEPPSDSCSAGSSDEDDSNVEQDISSDDDDPAVLDDVGEECLYLGDLGSCSLHSSSDITQDEAVLKVLNIYLKNNCTKSCLNDIITLICELLPPDNTMPSSIWQTITHVNSLAPPLEYVKHYYCSKCLVYFGMEMLPACEVCHSVNSNGVFYEFDIQNIVRVLFEGRNIAPLIDKQAEREVQDGVISDIQDGSSYKNVNQNRSKYDLTLVLGTDGLKLRKSSTQEVWLLMCMPVEVPANVREHFITIIGVWCDSQQPLMNTFLKPFCAKFKDIHLRGGVAWRHPMSGEEHKSKVIAPLFIADAPARAKVQNISNFNGKNPCNLCEVRSVRTNPVPGKKIRRVLARHFNSRLRDGRRMVAQARQAIESGSRIRGVKGPSVVSVVPGLNLADFVIPEYMHSVLLGIFRQLLYYWFEAPGIIKGHIGEINAFLNGIRPPDFVQRIPRNLSHLKFLKASELYYLLLFFCVPALKPYLPKRNFQHFLLLVRSIYILLQSNITERELQETEYLLRLFVQDMENIYGDREMSYNVHQLLHLCLIVRRWGPLHLTSAFGLENMNGIVSRRTHGKKHLATEIVKNISFAHGIQALKVKIQEQNLQLNELSFKVLGKEIHPYLTAEERDLLVSAGIINTACFERAQIGKVQFTSTSYKPLRTANYYVSWLGPTRTEYGSVRFFTKYEDDLYLFIDKFAINHVDIVYHEETRKTLKHLLPYSVSGVKTLLKFDSNLNLKKEMCVGDFICKQPNNFFQVM